MNRTQVFILALAGVMFVVMTITLALAFRLRRQALKKNAPGPASLALSVEPVVSVTGMPEHRLPEHCFAHATP